MSNSVLDTLYVIAFGHPFAASSAEERAKMRRILREIRREKLAQIVWISCRL